MLINLNGFIKGHKKEVLISLVSASTFFLVLGYLYADNEKKKGYFKRKREEKESFSEKMRQFFNPLMYFAKRRKDKNEIICEKETNKLAEILKIKETIQTTENEGKEIKEIAEIYDKTEQNLHEINFRILNLNAKFRGKGKKKKGKKKLKKAQYLLLKEQRTKLKGIVEDLYSFNRGLDDNKAIMS